MRSSRSILLGVVAFGVTLAGYLVGSSRSYDYDSSVTMENFVRTSSAADALTRQVVSNNHPLFSFIEHLVYDLSGSSAEMTMRIAPAAFAAMTVGLLGAWAARRWGGLAGITAAMVLGTNPVFVETSRAVRGYSLLVLAGTVSTLLCVRWKSLTTRRAWSIAAITFIGVATHLYMILVVIAEGAWLWGDRRWDKHWRTALGAGVTGGLLLYTLAGPPARTGRVFRATFPRDLVWQLLGRTGLAVGLVVVGLCLAAVRGGPIRAPRPARFTAGAVLLMIVASWLVAPTDLYPRFFVWLVPAVAVLLGWAAGTRSAVIGTLAIVASVSSIGAQLPTWTDDPAPLRAISLTVRDITDLCTIGYTYEAIAFYLPDATPVALDNLHSCAGVLVTFPRKLPGVGSVIQESFPRRCTVTANRADATLYLPHSHSCPLHPPP